MHRLNTPAKEGATTTTDMEFAELLVTKQFYFELDETPRYIDNRYQCTGYLRCRFQGPKQVKLLNHILKIRAGFTLGDKPLAQLRQPLSMIHGEFMHPVSFCVSNMNEEITIFLTSIQSKPTAISGFPTNITALACNQGLDSPFGTANHSKRTRQHPPPPPPAKRQRYGCG
ncbi:hypothetical protein FPQ18DRAFT_326978, partial [Pyronema domesticum]